MGLTRGRCHGPGCTQPAVVDLFCCPACEQAWTAALLEMPVVELRSPLADPQPDDEGLIRGHIEEAMDAKFSIADPRGVLSAGATYPQVAFEDPQVGWLSKWINRMRGRRP